MSAASGLSSARLSSSPTRARRSLHLRPGVTIRCSRLREASSHGRKAVAQQKHLRLKESTLLSSLESLSVSWVAWARAR